MGYQMLTIGSDDTMINRGVLPFKSIHYGGSGWVGGKLTKRNPEGNKTFKLSFSYLAAHLSFYIGSLTEPQSTLFLLRKHVNIYTYALSLSVSISLRQS